MTREPIRTDRVQTAAKMVRERGVSIAAAAKCLNVDVSEVRVALGLDRDLRGAR